MQLKQLRARAFSKVCDIKLCERANRANSALNNEYTQLFSPHVCN